MTLQRERGRGRPPQTLQASTVVGSPLSITEERAGHEGIESAHAQNADAPSVRSDDDAESPTSTLPIATPEPPPIIVTGLGPDVPLGGGDSGQAGSRSGEPGPVLNTLSAGEAATTALLHGAVATITVDTSGAGATLRLDGPGSTGPRMPQTGSRATTLIVDAANFLITVTHILPD